MDYRRIVFFPAFRTDKSFPEVLDPFHFCHRDADLFPYELPAEMFHQGIAVRAVQLIFRCGTFDPPDRNGLIKVTAGGFGLSFPDMLLYMDLLPAASGCVFSRSVFRRLGAYLFAGLAEEFPVELVKRLPQVGDRLAQFFYCLVQDLYRLSLVPGLLFQVPDIIRRVKDRTA